jgi:hypothetical protein
MELMLLIYNDENAWASPPDPERNAITREYFEFTDEMRDHGVYTTGAPLQPTTAGGTVRIRDDEQLVADGRSRGRRSSSAATSSSRPTRTRRRAPRRARSRRPGTARSRHGRCWQLVRRLQPA